MNSLMTDQSVCSQVTSLTIAYRNEDRLQRVVTDVNLQVKKGEWVGLVGESGSGKTTTGLAAMGYLRSDAIVLSGSVRFGDTELLGLPRNELRRLWGRRVGYVPQGMGSSLNPTMRIGDQVAEVLSTHFDTDEKESLRRALELFVRLGLPEPEQFARRYPHQISGGQQERVMLASVLAPNPELIVFDEPTSGLDVTTQAQIIGLLREIRGQTGVSAFFISHHLGVVAAICDSVAVMYRGTVVEHGSCRDVFRDPFHPYSRELLGAVPRVHGGGLSVETSDREVEGRSFDEGCAYAKRCPYAEDVCATEPRLEPGDANRLIRCWRSAEIRQQAPAAPRTRERKSPAVRAGVVPLLTVDDLHCGYAHPGSLFGGRSAHEVVSDASFSLQRCETLALVGESGSGKTTILRVVVGLMRPKEGAVEFQGQPLAGWVEQRGTEIRRNLQLVFQNPDTSLNPSHTVESALGRPLNLFHRLTGPARRKRIEELLQMVGLDPLFAKRYPDQLSGGEKQRVALARGLAANPELILCDEVVSALDTVVQAKVLRLLARLQNDLGLSYLFVTHDLAVVRALADRVVVLYQGQIMEIGPAERLLGNPRHPYTADLLAAVLEPDTEPRLGDASRTAHVGAPSHPGCLYEPRCRLREAGLCDHTKPQWQTDDSGYGVLCHRSLDDLEARLRGGS